MPESIQHQVHYISLA